MFASRGGALLWIALTSLAVGAGACAQIIGLQPFGMDSGGASASTTRGGGGGSSSAGDGGAASTSATSASGAGGGCAGTCAPRPDGFFGPVGVLVGAVAETCPAGWTSTATLFANPVVAGACSGCSCGAPQDECELDYKSCDVACGAGNGTCVNKKILDEPCYVNAVGSPMSVAIVRASAAAGSCDPTGSPIAPDVSFGTFAVRCKPPEGGACPGGETCVPPGAGVCVFADGDVGCPTPYPHKSSYLEGATPQCAGSCRCDTVTGTVCDPATLVSFFTDATCSSIALSPTPADGSCTNLNPVSGIMSATFVPTAAGSCAPIFPPATLKPGLTVTVCCQ